MSRTDKTRPHQVKMQEMEWADPYGQHAIRNWRQEYE